mgnify:CR=1 FL=1
MPEFMTDYPFARRMPDGSWAAVQYLTYSRGRIITKCTPSSWEEGY